jgi:AcrR family transcriptional regulator
MSNSLTKLDWLQAGFRALTKGGLQAIKVERIAKDLKVSKGSFYWHFKDISEFKALMIEHWQQAATANVIAQIGGGTEQPIAKLRALVKRSTSLPRSSYGGPASESAIRDWARYDPKIASIVSEIDTQRLAFTEALFVAAGAVAPQQAARLLYSALIGLEILAPAGLSSPEGDLIAMLDHLI